MEENNLDGAISALREGRMILIVDDADAPTAGDVCVAAECTQGDHVSFMAVQARGLVCMPLLPASMERLGIPLIAADRVTDESVAYGTSFEARRGVSTGISAADRALTIRLAVDSRSTAADIVRPGHVVPIQAAAGGVLEAPGRTAAAIDLARLAALRPAAATCAVLDKTGELATGSGLLEFAARHELPVVSVDAVVQHRLRHELLVERLDEIQLDSAFGGHFRAVAYRNKIDDSEHLALICGRLDGDVPLVRVHSQCLTGDVLGSRRCDCGEQLEEAVRKIEAAGAGVIVYLHQEGRGIGLANKIRAYALQDQGRDTVEANLELGFREDPRDYGISAQILRDLGVSEVRLLTNNARKIEGLERHGIRVRDRVPLQIPAHTGNLSYLRTKQEKLGHMLTDLPESIEQEDGEGT
jgi:3,4-dihydroxy 2-butanone 4-phosphate synthase/GTP cyclohydrolase II